MKAFRISGRFRMGRAWQPFSKELAANDEAAAREKLLSILGSQHGVPRKYVTIATVAEVPPEQVEDHAVKYALEARA
jgi:large subunit ribosomal protein LX